MRKKLAPVLILFLLAGCSGLAWQRTGTLDERALEQDFRLAVAASMTAAPAETRIALRRLDEALARVERLEALTLDDLAIEIVRGLPEGEARRVATIWVIAVEPALREYAVDALGKLDRELTKRVIASTRRSIALFLSI